nr:MAG: putative coat protein [Leviviridae sp.]
MAFAKPLVIAYAAGNKTLQLINQDSYGAEYYLRETTQEFRVKIRHTQEKPTATGRVHRHNVEFTRTVFGTAGAPDTVQQAFLVFRHDYRDNIADAAEIGASMTSLINEAAFNDLGGWLS